MPNPYENVEGAARFVLERFEVPTSKNQEADVEELLQKIRDGLCQACGNQLEKNTVLFVNRTGVVASYCCGPCVQDAAVIGWLQEQFQDVLDHIEMRNQSAGQMDEPEEGEDTSDELSS